MAAFPAGDLEHMPFSQIAEPNLIFRPEHVGLEFMAFGRGKVSRYRNVPVLFYIWQRHPRSRLQEPGGLFGDCAWLRLILRFGHDQ